MIAREFVELTEELRRTDKSWSSVRMVSGHIKYWLTYYKESDSFTVLVVSAEGGSNKMLTDISFGRAIAHSGQKVVALMGRHGNYVSCINLEGLVVDIRDESRKTVGGEVVDEDDDQ